MARVLQGQLLIFSKAVEPIRSIVEQRQELGYTFENFDTGHRWAR